MSAGEIGAEVLLAASSLDEMVWTLEDILDGEDMDRETCAAVGGQDLCGFSGCRESGCYTDKLNRARLIKERLYLRGRALERGAAGDREWCGG